MDQACLTGRRVRARAEEDAEARLVVDGLAALVLPASVDAIGEHERARLGVEHVRRGGVDVARDELERDAVIRAVPQAGRGGQGGEGRGGGRAGGASRAAGHVARSRGESQVLIGVIVGELAACRTCHDDCHHGY